MPSFQPSMIEPRWQQFWEQNKTFATPDPSGEQLAANHAKKCYILDMFPYPSGSGLHVGHPEGYTATDILARMKRMQGIHVLHPMGWDAFGLPAEQHAITTGEHPRINTQNNINNFRRQIKALGFSYDWEREVDTTDPNYFRWTQWIFLEIYDTWYDPTQKKGRPIRELPIPPEVQAAGPEAVRRYQDSHRLAYQAEVPVNWCPALGTVLANEEVIDGKSERGNHPVVRMPLRQWLMRITAYADRLIDDLDPLDWSESIKQMQRNWIGRSEGAEVHFAVEGIAEPITVFTTRPDTLFGATYMVLAPEHALVSRITTPAQADAVKAYQEQAARKSDFDRTEVAKVKTGVFTGAYAINPVTQARIPVWIADYVLATYGTGAIMAVPGHDERDFEFAKQFHLPIQIVVEPTADWLTQTKSTLTELREAYVETGKAINSGFLDGLETTVAKTRMIEWLEQQGIGKRRINYKLRDWLFSRQRYWGEPFPILHGPEREIVPLSINELPLELPEVQDYKPTGSPDGPLAQAKKWLTVERDGKTYLRETNTMPQWAGSCWYYLRYIDPKNSQQFADPAKLNYWLPVDLYVGGAEHAVLHLLYARFWHKVLFDRGHLQCPEPFQRLVNQGMILGEFEYHVTPTIYETSAGKLQELGIAATRRGEQDELTYVLALSEDQVEKIKGKMVIKGTDIEVMGKAEKMSKSRGNVVNPDDIVREYGADSLRLYEMFMGPLEAVKPWNTKSVEGVYRFLNRVWRLVVEEDAADTSDERALAKTVSNTEPDRNTHRILHRTIEKVTQDTEGLRFNTAISAMMELCNHLTKLPTRPKSVLETFVLLLAPYAPHTAEELWRVLGHHNTLAYHAWPQHDPALARDEEVEIPVQIKGKVRARIVVPADADAATLEAAARADAKVMEALAGQEIKKVIVVPKKMVNIVT